MSIFALRSVLRGWLSRKFFLVFKAFTGLKGNQNIRPDTRVLCHFKFDIDNLKSKSVYRVDTLLQKILVKNKQLFVLILIFFIMKTYNAPSKVDLNFHKRNRK